MKRKLLGLTVACSLAAASAQTPAAPFSSLDPRSMAMGGAGVAIARPSTAPFFNPALLSIPREEDDFAISFGAGGRVANAENFSDALDDSQDSLDVLDATITAVENELSGFQRVVSSTNSVNSSLAELSQEPLHAEAGGAFVVGVPGSKLGIAGFLSGYLVGDARANYRDEALLNDLSDQIQLLADCESGVTNCNPNAGGTLPTLDPTLVEVTFDGDGNPISANILVDSDDLESDADFRGVGISEAGVSLARDFGFVAVGITPKYMRVDTFDYRATVKDADQDDFDADDYTESYSDFNLDIGIAKLVGEHWRFGLTVRNLIAYEYDTVLKDDPNYLGPIEIDPQVRAGMSYDQGWVTLAADLDLTENSATGFADVEGDSRYLSLGAEFDVATILQLRTGLRTNLAHDDDSITEEYVPSVGLGLNVGGFTANFAVAGSGNDIGAALELGGYF